MPDDDSNVEIYCLKNNEIVGSSIFKNIVDATIMFLNNKL